MPSCFCIVTFKPDGIHAIVINDCGRVVGGWWKGDGRGCGRARVRGRVRGVEMGLWNGGGMLGWKGVSGMVVCNGWGWKWGGSMWGWGGKV